MRLSMSSTKWKVAFKPLLKLVAPFVAMIIDMEANTPKLSKLYTAYETSQDGHRGFAKPRSAKSSPPTRETSR